MFIDEISRIDVACRYQSSRIIRTLDEKEQKLYSYIDSYLRDYCEYNHLSLEDLLKIREKFSRRYLKDLDNYKKYKKYPYQLKLKQFVLARYEYDVVLILSFLLENHRFKIACWLASQKFKGSILSIGVGPGVEFGIIKEYLNCDVSLIGYDLELSDYVLDRYQKAVKKKYFRPNNNQFDSILLIEVLEHLSNPSALIKDACLSLNGNGRVFLTTAVDIPQFDHLFNFQLKEIIQILNEQGMMCEEIITVSHKLNTITISSKNELVIAKRHIKV